MIDEVIYSFHSCIFSLHLFELHQKFAHKEAITLILHVGLINWIVFYAASAIVQPYNGGIDHLKNIYMINRDELSTKVFLGIVLVLSKHSLYDSFPRFKDKALCVSNLWKMLYTSFR